MNISGFIKGSILQAWQYFWSHAVCYPPEPVHQSTNAQTTGTYTCAAADYHKLHKIKCVGSTFFIKGGTGSVTITGKAADVLHAGETGFVRFSADRPLLGYKEISGAAFSDTVFLTISRVEP